jgi:hypothetical protein
MQIEGDHGGPMQSLRLADGLRQADPGVQSRQPAGVSVRQDCTEIGESHQKIRVDYLPAVPQ